MRHSQRNEGDQHPAMSRCSLQGITLSFPELRMMLEVPECPRILLAPIPELLKVRLNSCTPETVSQPPDPKLV